MAQLKAVCAVSDEDTNALPVKDLGSAIAFYEAVLGFSVVSCDASTAVLTRDRVRIGLVRQGDHEPSQAGSLAFEVDDLEAMHREFQARGGNPGEFGIDEWGGKQHHTFFLREQENGYCYCFYRPLFGGPSSAWPQTACLKITDLQGSHSKDEVPGEESPALGWPWSVHALNGRSFAQGVIMLKRLSGGESLGKVIRCQTLAGLILTDTRHAPGSRQPRHCHEHAYFSFTRRGTYREEYGNQQRRCSPLLLVFHPREEVHAEQVDGEEVQSFNVEITPSWLRSVGTAPPGEPFDSRGGPLVGLAVRLFDEFEQPDASSPLIIEGLVLELLGLCIRAARKGPAVPPWLRQVRDLLREHCTTAFTLAGLAAEAGVHPGYLAATFHRHFGCTIGAYLRRQRVALACRDLANSDAPLADVALRVGFADQSHFTRTFKRQVGLTPAVYRKMTARAVGRSKT